MNTTLQNPIKIIALVPARSGSQRIRNKNLQVVGDRSLLQWSVHVAKRCKEIGLIVVSTDSEEYARLAESWGAAALARPPELASDSATDEDVLKHFSYYFPYDLCVYLRPTTPFREVLVIQEAIRVMVDAGDTVDSLRSVEEMGESSWKTFEVENGLLKPIVGSIYQSNLPNQFHRKTYRGNGYVDILRRPQWGEKVLAYVTPRVIEIDTPEDLEYARWWKEVRKG